MFYSPSLEYIAAPVYYQFSGAGFGAPANNSNSIAFASFATQPQSLVFRKEFPETWILDMLNFTDDRFVLRPRILGVSDIYLACVS